MKIQVVSVTPKKQGVKDGRAWTISEIETVEGNKYDTFDQFIAGQEYDVDVIPNKDPKYNSNVRKQKKQNDYTSAKQAQAVANVLNNKDDKEQRITMLSCISSACNFYQQRQATEEMVIKFAKSLFHEAMTHTTDNPPF